ncbi:hypothetical protein AYL99_00105 [Fonsecaea erecta]|uniref:Uncharacterized protein n=1 Tax=Fonsecaea erecta TaxID=1367422 RepID=A0A178ZY25_9EURO|nr:hypothetical protein AYL99_00105 [Fonsecaea erecta]OAP64133.1 hypothetical protein AYL99_00105 [Fonsecaea erecta]
MGLERYHASVGISTSFPMRATPPVITLEHPSMYTDSINPVQVVVPAMPRSIEATAPRSIQDGSPSGSRSYCRPPILDVLASLVANLQPWSGIHIMCTRGVTAENPDQPSLPHSRPIVHGSENLPCGGCDLSGVCADAKPFKVQSSSLRQENMVGAPRDNAWTNPRPKSLKKGKGN